MLETRTKAPQYDAQGRRARHANEGSDKTDACAAPNNEGLVKTLSQRESQPSLGEFLCVHCSVDTASFGSCTRHHDLHESTLASANDSLSPSSHCRPGLVHAELQLPARALAQGCCRTGR